MIYRTAVDVVNIYSPNVQEDDIGISTCHFSSSKGINYPFKLSDAADYLFAHLGDYQLPSFIP